MYHSPMRIKLRKWGNSLAVRIPRVFIVHLGLGAQHEIEMSLEDNRLILAPPKDTLRKLVEGITPENLHEPADWGEPMGSEVW
jgi:antitoxin MazE